MVGGSRGAREPNGSSSRTCHRSSKAGGPSSSWVSFGGMVESPTTMIHKLDSRRAMLVLKMCPGA